MSETLFENIISPSKHISTDALISLSEACRGTDSEKYADLLSSMIELLKKPNARLLKQPTFTWLGCGSSCFRFELHKALNKLFRFHMMEACLCEEGSTVAHYDAAVFTAKRALNNLLQWTAISPELVRYPPFSVNYVLAMASDAMSRKHGARFETFTKGIEETWKCGVLTSEMKQALEEVRYACRWSSLSNILWVREDGKGGNTSKPDDYETSLVAQYHRVSSYAAPTFQGRLDHASMCCGDFEDMQNIMDLNTKLYYMTPKEVAPPPPASLEMFSIN